MHRSILIPAFLWFLVSGLGGLPSVGAQAIDLGDIVAGGDGSGNAPPGNVGIDPRNGLFATVYINGPVSDSDAVADGVNPSPTASPYIDSVFFITEDPLITGGVGHNAITQSGRVYDFPAGDGVPGAGKGWNNILKDRNGGVSAPPVRVGGVALSTAVGIHASMGITFDLDLLRDWHGPAAVGCFSTHWGLDDCAGGDVDLFAILSSDVAGSSMIVRTAHFTAGQGAPMEPLEIPPTARYLTLATGRRSNDACDHGTFGGALITAAPCAPAASVILRSVDPRSVSTAGGTPITVAGEGFYTGMSVLLGGLPIADPSFVSSTEMRGKSPPLPAGFHAAEVAGTAGQVVARLERAVEAVSPLGVTGVDPREVARNGSTKISIHGGGFSAATRIRVGSHDLANPTIASPSLITGNAPALTDAELDGPRDVIAEDASGSATLPGAVVYVSAGSDKTSITERFARGDLSLSTITLRDGTRATRVELRGAEAAADVGEPILPVVLRRILVPKGARIRGVASEPGPLEVFPGHGTVEWAQSEQPIQAVGGAPRPPYHVQGPDGPVYYSPPPNPEPMDPRYLEAAVWPADQVSLVEARELGGFQVVTLRVSPVRWRPASRAIELTTSFKITLSHEGGALPDPAQVPDYRLAMEREELGAIVANPDLLPSPPDGFLRPDELDAEYLIITDNVYWRSNKTSIPVANLGDITAEFQRLADWKTEKGVKAAVVTVTDILSGRYGNFTKNTRDLQEVIRNFLKYAKAHFNTYWVLLGGNEQIVPVRRIAFATKSVEHNAPLKSKPKPDEYEAYLDPNTGLIRIHSDSRGMLVDFRDLAIQDRRTNMVFRLRHAPSAQQPGWTFMKDDSYSQESYDPAGASTFIRTEYEPEPFVPTPYVVVAGVPLNPAPTELTIINFSATIPTDLYYASVDSPQNVPTLHDWDHDGNGLYGEVIENVPIDGTDFHPDFALGRAPILNSYDAKYWVDKVLAYEKLEGLSAELPRELLLVSTNWWTPPAVSRGAVNPPKPNFYFSSDSATEAKLYFGGVPGDYSGLFDLIAYSSSNEWHVVPFSLNASPTNLGYYYCKDASYSTLSENQSVPTPFVLVRGPTLQIHPKQYFWDYVGPDGSLLSKEKVKELFEDNTSLDIRSRYYEDAEDSPTGLEPDLHILASPVNSTNPLLPALEEGFNVASLSGHGLWTGCCYFVTEAIGQYSKVPGKGRGVVYADSCMTGRFNEVTFKTQLVDGTFDDRLAFVNSVATQFVRAYNGGAAWIGSSSYGWQSTGNALELRVWGGLTTDRHLGRLFNRKWLYSLSWKQMWDCYSLHLLGDPEMPVWVGPPGRLKADYNPCLKRNETLWVTVTDGGGQPVNGALVCVSNDNGLFERAWTTWTGKAFFYTSAWTAGQSFLVTATATDYLPFQGGAGIETPSCKQKKFYRGDSNGDSRVDLSDAVNTLNFLFQGGGTPPCFDAADTNDDGKVDISDAVRLLGYLFLGEPRPPGLDPTQPTPDDTPDGLGCESAPAAPGQPL